VVVGLEEASVPFGMKGVFMLSVVSINTLYF
jgi:hypothetical protein